MDLCACPRAGIPSGHVLLGTVRFSRLMLASVLSNGGELEGVCVTGVHRSVDGHGFDMSLVKVCLGFRLCIGTRGLECTAT